MDNRSTLNSISDNYLNKNISNINFTNISNNSCNGDNNTNNDQNNRYINKGDYILIKSKNEDSESKFYVNNIRLNESSLNKYNIHGYFYDIYNNILNGNLIEDGPLIQLNNNKKIKLKLHQKRMLYEMLSRENISYRLTSRINAFVLSDKVGSGKSIDMLALISIKPTIENEIPNVLHYKPCQFLYCDFYGIKFEPTFRYKTNVIVVPHGIILQWVDYLKFFENLTYYTISNIRDLKALKHEDLKNSKYNIILIKSTKYHSFCDKFNIEYNIEYTDNKSIIQTFPKIKNLKRTIDRTCYNFQKYKFIYAFQNYFNDLKETINNFTEKDLSDIHNYANLTKANLVIKGPLFERVIFDEASTIKIPRCRKMYGKINWFITSSFNDLLEPYKYIRTTGFIKNTFCYNNSKTHLNFIQEIYLKNNDEFIKKSFELPEPIYNYIECYTPPDIYILKNIAMPEVITSLNAGDINSAISIVGCKKKNENDIKKVVLQKLNEKYDKYNNQLENHNNNLSLNNNIKNHIDTLYNNLIQYNLSDISYNTTINENESDSDESLDDILENQNNQNNQNNKELEEFNNIIKNIMNKNLDNNLNDLTIYFNTNENSNFLKNNYKSIIKCIKKKKYSIKSNIKNVNKNIKSIEEKINSLKDRISNIEKKNCPICIDIAENPCISACCNQTFCFKCITLCINSDRKKRCPMCRVKFNLSKLTLLDNSANNIEETNNLLTKNEMLLKILNDNPNGRYLIFSEYENTFNNIIKLFEKNEIKYNRLNGSAGRIRNIIKDYKTNKINILLLNAKYYGSGLNLQMTSDIIIYHRMNRELEEQLIGRGQRLGRTSQLKIHHLCYENELK